MADALTSTFCAPFEFDAFHVASKTRDLVISVAAPVYMKVMGDQTVARDPLGRDKDFPPCIASTQFHRRHVTCQDAQNIRYLDAHHESILYLIPV
jgi:hypothetical protein